MASTIIVGDGPAGLSAALFLAKNDHRVTVLGTDDSWVHKAKLMNYLGIEAIDGPDFMARARAQVAGKGATLRNDKVVSIRRGDGFDVEVEGGDTLSADYVILATGPKPELIDGVGLERDGTVVAADRNGRTAVDGFYAVGWAVRPDKIQAIISAGDGAAAALDILSREKGKEFHDFDTV